MALLLGSSYAIEICKPSLCHVMMSTAAGLCQSLGFHRYSTMKDDSEEDRNSKIHVFWMIYMFDKTMSLRLGRASIIQDFDIELPFLDGNDKKGKGMLDYWVKVGISARVSIKVASLTVLLGCSGTRSDIREAI